MPKLSPWSELYLQAVKWADFAGNNRDALAAAARGWSSRPGSATPFPDIDTLAELAAAVAVSTPLDFPETQARLKAAIALAKAEWDAFDAGEKERQETAERKRFGAPPPVREPREIYDPVKERIDR